MLCTMELQTHMFYELYIMKKTLKHDIVIVVSDLNAK